jgi:hypothetical protein
VSRKAHRRGVESSVLTGVSLPLTLRITIGNLLA